MKLSSLCTATTTECEDACGSVPEVVLCTCAGCTTILPPGPVCDVFCGKAFPEPGHHGSGCSCRATCNSQMYECTKHGPNSGCSCFCNGGEPQIMGGGECHRLY